MLGVRAKAYSLWLVRGRNACRTLALGWESSVRRLSSATSRVWRASVSTPVRRRSTLTADVSRRGRWVGCGQWPWRARAGEWWEHRNRGKRHGTVLQSPGGCQNSARCAGPSDGPDVIGGLGQAGRLSRGRGWSSFATVLCRWSNGHAGQVLVV